MYVMREGHARALFTNITFDLLFIRFRYHDQLDAIEAKFPIEENQVSLLNVNVCMSGGLHTCKHHYDVYRNTVYLTI